MWVRFLHSCKGFCDTHTSALGQITLKLGFNALNPAVATFHPSFLSFCCQYFLPVLLSRWSSAGSICSHSFCAAIQIPIKGCHHPNTSKGGPLSPGWEKAKVSVSVSGHLSVCSIQTLEKHPLLFCSFQTEPNRIVWQCCWLSLFIPLTTNCELSVLCCFTDFCQGDEWPKHGLLFDCNLWHFEKICSPKLSASHCLTKLHQTDFHHEQTAGWAHVTSRSLVIGSLLSVKPYYIRFLLHLHSWILEAYSFCSSDKQCRGRFPGNKWALSMYEAWS